MFRSSRRIVLAFGMVVCFTFAVLAARARDRDENIVVKSSVENFRDAPNGKRLGTLFENVEIERISQEGKWVRFRVEGWIWGPSLEGWKMEAEAKENDVPPPSMPLQDNLPRLKRHLADPAPNCWNSNKRSPILRTTKKSLLHRRLQSCQRSKSPLAKRTFSPTAVGCKNKRSRRKRTKMIRRKWSCSSSDTKKCPWQIGSERIR